MLDLCAFVPVPEFIFPRPLFLAVCGAVFGAVFGSFLNVVVWRLPLGMSLNHPGSHCPKCKHPLGMRDNIPIFGWILLGGKCRYCKDPISFRYPTVETVCCLAAGSFAGLILLLGWTGPDHSLIYWNEFEEFFKQVNKTWLGQDYLTFPNGLFALLLKKGSTLAALWSGMFMLELACGLIRYDGHKIPKSLFVFLSVYFLLSLIFIGGITHFNGLTAAEIIKKIGYMLIFLTVISFGPPLVLLKSTGERIFLFALLIPFLPMAALMILYCSIGAVQFIFHHKKNRLIESTGLLICSALPVLILISSFFPRLFFF